MAVNWNQILGGISGAFTGLAADQDRKQKLAAVLAEKQAADEERKQRTLLTAYGMGLVPADGNSSPTRSSPVLSGNGITGNAPTQLGLPKVATGGIGISPDAFGGSLGSPIPKSSPIQAALTSASRPTAPKVTTIGDQQFVPRDPSTTTEGRKELETQRKADEKVALRVPLLRKLPEYADATQYPDEMLHAIAADDALFTSKLTDKGPVPGTPAYDNLKIREARIAAQYGYHPDELVPVQQDDGSSVYMSRAQAIGKKVGKAGGVGGTNLPAPLAAKVGQFGEMLKKGYDLLPAMEALDVGLGGSASQDIATHGIGVGSMRLPGTQGVGSLMLNRTPEYSRYQAALSPFVLAAAHALSGARINDTQVQQIRASIEIKPGDTQEVRAQKHKNLIDLTNSIGGSLPASAIAAQEDQMDPAQLTLLRGHGYKGAARGTTTPVTPTTTGKPPSYEDWLKSKGHE